MNPSVNLSLARRAEWSGDNEPLAEQLGAAEVARPRSWTLRDHPRGRCVVDAASLGVFLAGYRSELLFPVELPVVREAFQLACGYQVRELLELDRAVGRFGLPADLGFASQAIGRSAVRRLRPLRDVRMVRRYLAALDARQVGGWHTVVYGVVLAIYSVPLRQGLLHYARQTLTGFIESAGYRLGLSRSDCRSLAQRHWVPVPREVDRLLQPSLRLMD